MISVGTFGSKKCEVVLNDLLIKLDDEKVVKFICAKYGNIRSRIKSLEKLEHDYHYFLNLYRDKINEYLKEKSKELEMPLIVYTHLMCCVHAAFAEAVRKRKNEANMVH